jgi:hypothetical protein
VLVPVLARGGTANRGEARLFIDQRIDKLCLKRSGGTVDLESPGAEVQLYRKVTGHHTCTSTDAILGVNSPSASVTVTLPLAAGQAGRFISVKDLAGAAGSWPITVATQSPELLDGAGSYIISTSRGGAAVFSDGLAWFLHHAYPEGDPMAVHGFAYKHNQSLTTTATIGVVTEDLTNDAKSDDFPLTGSISSYAIELTSIAGGATKITSYLAWDSAGDHPITPTTDQTITLGPTSGKGGISLAVDIAYKVPASGTAGEVYIVAKTDAGTATASTRIYWVQ